MSDGIKTPKQVSVSKLIIEFQACLLALLPQMDAVGVEWRDGKACDDCDRIEEALFESIVSTPIIFTPSRGASAPLPPYKFYGDFPMHSSLFDKMLGETYKFFCLERVNMPSDAARFWHQEAEDVLRSVAECRFMARLRASRSDAIATTDMVNIE